MKTSRVIALGALLLSLASAALFSLGDAGDPHEGPFWLVFLAWLWPVVLCPLSCLGVLVALLSEGEQPNRRRLATLAVAGAAALLPWLPGMIMLKVWLGPQAALRDSSPVVRRRAAEALADQAGPFVVAALAPALKDPDDGVRLSAAIGLWNQGPEAEPAALALLDALDDPVPGVRWWAMDTLARIPGTAPSAIPRLLRALQTRPEDKLDVIEALYWYGPQAAPAVPAICATLSLGQPAERRRAARTLGAIGAEAQPCLPALRMHLQDEREAIRETARASLVALGDTGPLPPSVVESWPELSFTPEAWRATPYWIDAQTTLVNQRYVFYRDLARRGLLEHKPAAEIEALLGPPHTNDRWLLLYHLKSPVAPAKGDTAATWWLEIPLDRERRATAVRLSAE